MSDTDEYLPVRVVAKAWGRHPSTVRRAITSGRIHARVTPGGQYLVHRDHLQLPAAPTRSQENA